MVHNNIRSEGVYDRYTVGQEEGISSGMQKKSRITAIAKVISLILHPFLVPVYAVAVYMLIDPIMALAPTKITLYLSIVTALGAILIPAFSIWLLRASGLISSLSLERQQDRTISLTVVAISYGICIFMISGVNPLWTFMIRKLFIAIFCSSVAAICITSFYKISLHMIAAGGITALFITFAIGTIENWPLFIPLSLSFFFSGVLASARLYLGKDTPAQIGVGFLTGMAITIVTLFWIN